MMGGCSTKSMTALGRRGDDKQCVGRILVAAVARKREEKKVKCPFC
jgi:hypothetical protein